MGSEQCIVATGLDPKPQTLQALRTMHCCPVGIDATGLDPNLDCHHLVVNDWQDLEASQNVCIISIPTVFDKSLAPAGKATIHAYVAANEPYEMWVGLDRGSKEYKDRKVCHWC